MKILLLGFAKMKLMPYASFYLNQIDYSKHEVEMVYWNRDLQDEDLSSYNPSIKFHEFRSPLNDWIDKKQKITHFFKYRQFVSNLLSKSTFDLVICLHTFPGLLILDKLFIKYRKHYIFDYRDSTFESNYIFGKLIKILSKNSILTFTSSDAFRRFLPSKGVEIITSHNLLIDSINHREDIRRGYMPSEKIRIAFWGLMRHLDHNIRIIDHLSNDPRFELHYYGREGSTGKEIRNYVKMKDINNVFIHGEYVPNDRYEFAKKTDIIHNSYDDANMRLAVANKYYDGIIFRIPQLCMLGSYMAQQCEEKGIGFALDPRMDDYSDQLYHLYHNLNHTQFEDNCDKELNLILQEYNYGNRRIHELLTESLI